MFKFIQLISALIRQFLLPNPYMNLFKEEVYANLFNIIIGGYILHKLSFWLTRMGYTKGVDEPEKGSIGYLFSYIILTFIITLIGKIFTDIKFVIGIFLIIYIILCVLVNKIFNRNNYL